MRQTRTRLAIWVVVAATLAAACALPGRANPRDVEARISGFLIAVRDRADGSGWDHLLGDVRASYPGGRSAWMEAVGGRDTSGLTWQIDDVSVDDYVGCARVDFGTSRDSVPTSLFDKQLPPMARVASDVAAGVLFICATIGPLPLDAGIHGVG